MDKQLFDDAIGEVPRSTIDVDAVMARGRRADRIRKVASPTVVAGVAVVAAVGAIAFTMMGGDGTGDGTGDGIQAGTQPTSQTTKPTGPSSTVVTTSSPSGSATNAPVAQPPAACASPDVETPTEVVNRLSQAAKPLVEQKRPDLRFSNNSAGNGRAPFVFGQEKDKQGNDRATCDRYSNFVAAASTEGPEGKGNIVISLGPAFFATPPGPTCEEVLSTGAPYCEDLAGPNGEVIRASTDVQPNGITTKMVDIVRPDGTQVIVQAGTAPDSVKSDEAAGSALTPLDFDQLVAIGIDPGLSLFP